MMMALGLMLEGNLSVRQASRQAAPLGRAVLGPCPLRPRIADPSRGIM